MTYTVIYSDRTTMTLYVNPDGSLEVRAPRRTPRRAIDDFVKSKSEWVEKMRNKKPCAKAPENAFAYGKMFSYRGVEYPLVSREGEYCGFNGKEFYLPPGLDGEQIRLSMIDLYKSLALPVFRESLRKFSDITGIKYPSEVKITSAKKRWGSCGGKGGDRINFSWMLITVCDYDADYVVVHELSHILHHDHSPAFWAQVDKYIPDRKKREARLSEAYKKLYAQGWL